MLQHLLFVTFFVIVLVSAVEHSTNAKESNPTFPVQCLNTNMDPETQTNAFRSKMHFELRGRVINELVKRSGKKDGIIFIEGNKSGDFFVETKQNIYFVYLSGGFIEGYQLAVNVSNGETFMFAPEYTQQERIWSYAYVPTLAEIRATYGVSRAYWKTDLQRIVTELRPSVVYTLPNQQLPFSNNFPRDATRLKPIIDELRSVKTESEIRLMKVAIRTSALAHVEVIKHTSENQWEYTLQSVFDSHCRVCGLKWPSYPPIVGGGNRSAVLHYVDNNRRIPRSPQSNLLLIDAGSDYLGYATDITRSYPANGKFTTEQKMVYETVLNAQKAAISTLKPGSKWSDASSACNRALLAGLKQHGFINGEIEPMLAQRVHNLFLLHGLGHHLGLHVHDSGPLVTMAENMVVTVEPGIYFHEFVFQRATQEQKRYLVPQMIEKFKHFGGIRIEDCIRITKTGSENLSIDVPKEVNEIEKLMKSS